jgi:G:T-mismatch repair DNA endonuclease (very short patch repair protein)
MFYRTVPFLMKMETALVKKKHDRLVNQTLRQAGWRVLRIWECSLQKHPQSCINRILRALD